MYQTVPLFYVASIMVGFATVSVQYMICRKNLPVMNPVVKRKSTTLLLAMILVLNMLDCLAPYFITSWYNPAGPFIWILLHCINFRKIWISCPQIGEGQNVSAITATIAAVAVPAPEVVRGVETLDEKIHLAACQYGLSGREVEIATLICQGKNTCEIAEELYLSPNTVKVHTSNLYRKIGVKNRVQALQVFQNR